MDINKQRNIKEYTKNSAFKVRVESIIVIIIFVGRSIGYVSCCKIQFSLTIGNSMYYSSEQETFKWLVIHLS